MTKTSIIRVLKGKQRSTLKKVSVVQRCIAENKAVQNTGTVYQSYDAGIKLLNLYVKERELLDELEQLKTKLIWAISDME